MIGTKELCTLLLAGGIGATSVVTVQKVKPAITKAKAKPAKVHKSAERNIVRTAVTDCPTPGPVLSIADMGPMPGMQPDALLTSSQMASAPPGGGIALPPVIGGGGGGGGLVPDFPVSGVPSPDSWVLMVAGFGFVGMAVRRPRRPQKQNS